MTPTPTDGRATMNAPARARRILAAALSIGILALATGGPALALAPTPGPSAPAEEDGLTGPQFYAGVTVDVAGDVDGDIYASGQSVTISGDVTGDVIAAAQTIAVTGTVNGNVRLAGQDVTIGGAISRSATILAANVAVAREGSIGGDMVAAASTIDIGGDVGRDLYLSVGHLSIDGSVGGDVTYYSDAPARIAEGAVEGAVERIQPPQTPRPEVSFWAAVLAWSMGVLYALVSLSLLMLLAGMLVPRWLHRVTGHLVPSPWKALLVGAVASVAVPGALLFLLVTIIGAPLALMGMLVWLVLTLATFVYGAYYIGRLVLRGDRPPLVKALVGGLLLIVALQIPWLNIAVWIAMVLFGLGGQLLEFYEQRPWRVRRDMEPMLSSEPPTATADPVPPA